jgi:hypothetical protein
MATVMRPLFLLLAALALSAGCGDKPTQADCEKLLDHVIEIEMSASGSDTLTPDMKADIDKQKRQLRDYLKKQFLEQCLDKTPGAVVKCGLKARDHQQLAACDKS